MYINEVRLVGTIAEAPKLQKSDQGRDCIVLALKTGKAVKTNSGKKIWIFSVHRVVVFDAGSIDRLKGQGEGHWITVRGELSYHSRGNSKITVTQIVVDELGDARPMFKDCWKRIESVSDEEYALVAEAVGADSGKAEEKPKSRATSRVKPAAPADTSDRDIDDEIPF
jgi:single-stranded DNA-binding protein